MPKFKKNPSAKTPLYKKAYKQPPLPMVKGTKAHKDALAKASPVRFGEKPGFGGPSDQEMMWAMSPQSAPWNSQEFISSMSQQESVYGVVTNPSGNPGRQEAYRKQLWTMQQADRTDTVYKDEAGPSDPFIDPNRYD